MLPIPGYLLEQGITDMVRIPGARMSGTSYGACVLHVAPEPHAAPSRTPRPSRTPAVCSRPGTARPQTRVDHFKTLNKSSKIGLKPNVSYTTEGIDSVMSGNNAFSRGITRRGLLGGLAAGAVASPILAACGAPGNGSGAPAASAASLGQVPSEPVTLNVLDVAGNLQLTKPILSAFQQKYPNIIKNITTTTGTAPELAPKIEAMQQAGNVQIQLVLTGTDGLSAGITKGLWYNLKP